MYSTHLRLVLGAGLIFLCLPNARASLRYYDQFSSWYPEYGFIFQNLLEQNCSQEYHTYLYGTEDDTPVPWNDGAGEYTMYVEPVVQCLLASSSQYLMSSLIMSQLLLALTPTVLASVGVSSIETSLIAIVGKRPLLAAMLALASPATYISRAFKHNDIRKLLLKQDSQYHRKRKDIPLRQRHLLVAFQYVLAAAALANVIIVNWNLGTQAICMLTTSFIYFPTIWTIIAIVLHGVMTISYHFRIKVHIEVDKQSTPSGFSCQIPQFLVHEFSLLGTHNFSLTIKRETFMVFIVHWFHSVFAIGQLVFGTLMFAGMLFIGPQDALLVFLRYFASSLICRTILVFEFSGLKEAYNPQTTQTREQTDEDVRNFGKGFDK